MNKYRSSVTISGNDLANLLDVKKEQYCCLLPNINMTEILESEISGFPVGTRKVSSGKFVSGDVWLDNHYNSFYFYVGKLSNNRDVVLNLQSASFEVGHINRENDKIYFDERVFRSR